MRKCIFVKFAPTFVIVIAIAFVLLALIPPTQAATVYQLRSFTAPADQMGGVPMIGINTPGWVDARVLAAGVAESYTIPAGAKFIMFSATTTFYANYGGTAAVPSADVTNGTAAELNPILRQISPGVTAVSLISPYPCIITISVFK